MRLGINDKPSPCKPFRFPLQPLLATAVSVSVRDNCRDRHADHRRLLALANVAMRFTHRKCAFLRPPDSGGHVFHIFTGGQTEEKNGLSTQILGSMLLYENTIAMRKQIHPTEPLKTSDNFPTTQK
jgi:LmbE family N-acetylglucosaminyl deacetylase